MEIVGENNNPSKTGSMKILFTGHHNPHFSTITEYMERAIRSLGHDLFVFEDRLHRIPGRVREKIPVLNRLDQRLINRSLLAVAEKVKPEIMIVTGGHRISPETIQKFKDRGVLSILWTIDAPSDFQLIIDAAPLYDHIFCQGTEAVELLDQAGIVGARWLPMACDPSCHHPVTCPPSDKARYGSDLVFVGSYYAGRASLFEKITKFDLAIWGPGWDSLDRNSPLRRCIRGAHTTPEEWLKIYSASKIVLAAHYHDPQNSFPVYQASPRIFEALACGAFVICDRQRDVFSLFKEEDHLVSFYDSNDLIDKVTYYLEHAEERTAMATRGRAECLAKHTYVHRIQALLSLIESHV
jgi:spore maturation protein CgeB